MKARLGALVALLGASGVLVACPPEDGGGPTTTTSTTILPTQPLTVRASVSTSDIEGADDSSEADISGNGRFVAFTSVAENLVANDTNGRADVFVRDLVTGATERVSIAPGGGQINTWNNTSPSISDDGRYVAFLHNSAAMRAIYVHDRSTGTTEVASLAVDGTPRDVSSVAPKISGDGRSVVFQSSATLVPGVNSGYGQVYLRDLDAGTTEVVDLTNGGAPVAFYKGEELTVSANGRHVAFITAIDATDNSWNGWWHVYLRDRVTATTERISVHVDGTESAGGGGEPSISADGRYVAFRSAGGGTLLPHSVFVRDRTTGTTTAVSVATDGAAADAAASAPSIDASGRYVAFESVATNLVAGDTNGLSDVFVRDRTAGTTQRVSLTWLDAQSTGASTGAVISDGGAYVAFTSQATDLVDEDTNLKSDVFVRGPLGTP